MCRLTEKALKRLGFEDPANTIYQPVAVISAALETALPGAEIHVGKGSHGLCVDCFLAIEKEGLDEGEVLDNEKIKILLMRGYSQGGHGVQSAFLE